MNQIENVDPFLIRETIGKGFSNFTKDLKNRPGPVAGGGGRGAECSGDWWNACYECDRIAKLVVGPRLKQVGLVSSRVTTTVRY